LAAGDISYSAVRTLCRLTDPSPEVEAALIEVARCSPVLALERAVRYYQLHHHQHDPTGADPSGGRYDRRGVRMSRGLNGLGTAELCLDAVELEELHRALQAFLDPGPTDQSARADWSGPVEAVPWWQRRADAFMDLVRTGLAHAQDGHAVGADRYMVHAVTDLAGRCELIDGTPIDTATLGRLTCDATTVAHTTRGDEPLAVGRRSRDWNTAQRRAITVRDGGRCRFPGCQRRRCDIHHLDWWSQGGPTDIANGALFCSRHHTLIHKRGFTVMGDANGSMAFHGPDGAYLDSTVPAGRVPTLPLEG
jgi:hypothetical protein